MPANRNALIRYTTIDKCLRNRYRQWTLEDLIDACSDTLYEYEGIDKGVSKRTIQMDIQIMRSEKLGYNAPIIVQDKKYYTYEDPDYSITQLPLSEQDLNKLGDAVEILKQFQGFSHFKEMTGLIQKLENKIYTENTQSRPIIHIERNENLKGLEHLNGLYQVVLRRQVIKVEYQSFKAKRSGRIYFNPYLLKEFNNRWFLIGKQKKGNTIMNLALDRIHSFEVLDNFKFKDDPEFNPDNYYKNVIGATVNTGLIPRTIKIFVNNYHKPYILTKPLHWSQYIVEERLDGIIIAIKVVPNFELERLILGYGDSIEVLSPPSLRKQISKVIQNAFENYNTHKE
ncbi:YafY family protein [Carboxylicivirga sp. M1479]|uniref:helix-turn-helix transcriptional regulator n=1 Tax=Carboxylicivirga sp. M1479 TaxID=2594476 RepID=UPI001178948F|nr:WYL domain-containing protein [Carboxylicivirga sp. M1479]TRX66388.1 WYL domain-containing protein [Carboxylicivirga sp. M1479]